MQMIGVPLKHSYFVVEASAASNFEEVRKRVTEDPSKAEEMDDLGNTPLIKGAVRGSVPILQFLLKFNVNINTQNKKGKTALYEAASHGKRGAVEFLLLNNADYNIKTIKGWSSLFAASKNGNPEVVKLLLSNTTLSPNDQDDDGNTPLHIAVNNKHTEVIDLFLDVKGVRFNIRNRGGRAAFDLAPRKFIFPFRAKMDAIISEAREKKRIEKDAKKAAKIAANPYANKEKASKWAKRKAEMEARKIAKAAVCVSSEEESIEEEEFSDLT